MAEERAGTRETDSRKKPTWVELLGTFLIALDPFKLLLAAMGILATAVGWWLISAIFYGAWSEPRARDAEIGERREYYKGKGRDDAAAAALAEQDYNREANRFELMKQYAGPGGWYRSMPWYEERGRNPFLLATGAVEGSDGQRSLVGGVAGEGVVLIEPLRKFLGPILLLFEPLADFWVQVYALLLLFWLLIVWGFFGGVITRMAIVQMAGKEGGGLRESVKFVRSRYVSYLSSPIVPVLLIFAVVLGCIIFGLFHLIPLFGDIVVDGLFWWIPLGAGFVMALLVVGLVGYPLMYTTLSAEGSDTFDALSRSYNYVYESPWSYLWYAFVSLVYGAIVVFFVVFMTSLMVYLGKWGVSRTPLTQTFNRSPDYLFVYSPTSFGWRELLLKGSPIEITPDVQKAGLDKNLDKVEPVKGYWYVRPDEAAAYMKEYSWYNYAGAGMVSFWLTLLFMLMLGFSYSYFWTASSMIYLMMRRKVDEVEIDEIYTEEEDFEESVPPKSPTAATPTSIAVDPPTLRVSPAPAVPPTSPPSESTPSTSAAPTSGALPGSPIGEKADNPPEPPVP